MPGGRATIIHAHNDSIRRVGRDAADDYLAVWKPLLGELPDLIWYPTGAVGAARSAGEQVENA